ncbi:hypothetical protein CAOG_06438 [Capsaspora owczarzaki ATCC 30864]|uniref:Uncharacterized protein n=1 Tax=Capsaspora owczarzaki (strain ATCC 30864) TaxID=595528 RepID=A0A0D2WU18_CAPO3|nr:hypothetical protein CAOG_06438 [Capsaspora owczarzaki ATCC 30864]KJE96065.1 hypothetical protein CAOG_006438 [Capsaspora owczarzaki ATCC 30864]KJE96066.1 hypothetical protein, variant [Capsaspora owczarzaki ATCC 30864]|eukprot:XP_004345187.2 hypothetical protein CAOG_06438 [Capsaspora owczarzaki ATCC 30864]
MSTAAVPQTEMQREAFSDDHLLFCGLDTDDATKQRQQQPFVARPDPGTTFTISQDDLDGLYNFPDPFKGLRREHGRTIDLVDRKLPEEIFLDLLGSNKSPKPRYLAGVGGAGKSSIMLMLAVLAMRHNKALFAPASAPAPASTSTSPLVASAPGPARASFDGVIFLIYQPATYSFVDDTAELAAFGLIYEMQVNNRRFLQSRMFDEPAFEVLKDAFVRRKTSSRDSEASLDQWGRIKAALKSLESQSHRFRVLVLIDQWNAIIEANALPVGDRDKLEADHPAQDFSRLDASFGCSLFVTAIGSSLSNGSVEVWCDAQAGDAKVTVQPLTPEEAETLRAIWYYRSPSLAVTREEMQRQFLDLGGVVHILQWYASSHFKNNFNSDLQDMYWSYYGCRLDRVRKRATSKRRLVEDLTAIFVHGQTLETLDDVWLETNMVKRDPDDPRRLIPVSPCTRRAALAVLNQMMTDPRFEV